MAAITFPRTRADLVPPGTGPLQEGDTFMFPPMGGDTYEYDVANNRWLAQQTGGASVTVSQVPPAMASNGDLWWYCGADDEDPSLFTYVDDAAGVGSWIQSSPGIAFESSSGGGGDDPVSIADFLIANNDPFPFFTLSTTNRTQGPQSGTLTWITQSSSVNVYQGMGNSQTETIFEPLTYAVGDWVEMSNTSGPGTNGSSSSSTFTIALNGIDIASITATHVRSGATTPGNGGGYITQAMIDARSGSTEADDVWTYNLGGSGGASTVTGSAILYRDSAL